MSALPVVLDADEVRAALSPAEAVRAIEDALRGGLDPSTDIARTAVDVPHGQLLLMPSAGERHVGVKIVGIAPDNPSHDLPRIHALYALLHASTLQPVALLDGTALTALRTPAVSVAAIRPALRRFAAPLRVVVFGAGPQAVGHIEALSSVVPVGSVTVVVRDPSRVRIPDVTVLAADDPGVADVLSAADVVVCATTAREPLFDSELLADRTVVVAVGSHEPAAREVDSAFCGRATVVVEDVATALREGGDVVLAIEDGSLDATRLVPLREAVLGQPPSELKPLLFKGSGMSWQDLVVAEAVLDARNDRRHEQVPRP